MNLENVKVLSVAEMRAADRYTIEKGTPSKVLMKRAAQGVYDAYGGWKGAKTLVVCGSGNNGGDGYALAEILQEKGEDVTLLLLYDRFSEDGRYYHERCVRRGVRELRRGTDEVRFGAYDILVDCMLGTGFRGTPEEPIASAIREINRARAAGGPFVISVDINSGMNGDTGEGALAVKSDLTVSVGFLKTGFFRGRAGEWVGALTNADIGIEIADPSIGHSL